MASCPNWFSPQTNRRPDSMPSAHSNAKRREWEWCERKRERKHKEFVSWKPLIKRSCAHYMLLLIRMKLMCFGFWQPQTKSQSTFGHMSLTQNTIDYTRFLALIAFLIDMKAIYNTNKAPSMLLCGLLSLVNCWSFYCVYYFIKIYSVFLHIFISRWPINQQ